MKKNILIFAVLAGFIAVPAMAANCDLKGVQPMPIDQAIKAAQELGYKDITQVELERGCYEFEGMDKEGKKPVDFKLNAGSGEFVSERRDISKSLVPKAFQ